MTKLFGTDGIRGVAYEPPLDRDTVIRVGTSLSRHLDAASPHVLLGRDTRASGPDIESWLTTGIVAGGGRVSSAGVVPTPGVAFLTRTEGFDAGVVISASHNPYRDNGIKVFSSEGVKSSESLETSIESDVAGGVDDAGSTIHSATPSLHLEKLYAEYLVKSLEGAELPRLKIALDCANGAGYRVGPSVLSSLGLDVVSLFDEPDGENVNRDCGSTSLGALQSAVVDKGCDLGAALDGDGDRVLLVDAEGRIVDGDAILLLCARRLQKEGRLAGDGVVATVMSNMALEVALGESGITLLRTAVGDKHVAQEMTTRGMILGGEQSGHIIFSEFAATGDGLLTLLQVLRVIGGEAKGLGELAHLEPFPQVLENVRVRSRPDVRTIDSVRETIEAAEERLGERGRVLIRYSGTEPLLRIMMEGPDEDEIHALVGPIREAVTAAIGSEHA